MNNRIKWREKCVVSEAIILIKQRKKDIKLYFQSTKEWMNKYKTIYSIMIMIMLINNKYSTKCQFNNLISLIILFFYDIHELSNWLELFWICCKLLLLSYDESINQEESWDVGGIISSIQQSCLNETCNGGWDDERGEENGLGKVEGEVNVGVNNIDEEEDNIEEEEGWEKWNSSWT